MKKSGHEGRSWLIFLILIAAGLYFLLFAKRSVKLMDEQEVFTDRETMGLFWVVIQDESSRMSFSNRYKVKLPENDFKKFNLLVSDGRKILKLKYQLISKYRWRYRDILGEEIFDSQHHPHSMFVYRIKKIYLHRAHD